MQKSPVCPLTLSVIVPAFNERPNVAPLIEKLTIALAGIAWEVIYVDDNSPDGTTAEVRRIAQRDARVRCITRIGRRGLASAVIEGALSSSALYLAVIDGDLQHDETLLPKMLHTLNAGAYDLVIASRHVEGGNNTGLANQFRHWLSDGGIRLAQLFLPAKLSDPMSGYFMLTRACFERLAPKLTGQGFKILLDIVMSGDRLRFTEIPATFRERLAGESKLDLLVMIQFAGMLLDKVCKGYLPLRFFSFAIVGGLGLIVHLSTLLLLRHSFHPGFAIDQAIATFAAMIFNFEINNRVTYRDQKLKGSKLLQGFVLFVIVCGMGALANISISEVLFETHTRFTVAAGLGAIISLVWNYAVSSTLVWRPK